MQTDNQVPAASSFERPAIDDYGMHELLDRTHMVLAMIDDFLLGHKDAGSQLDVKEHFEKASDELSKAYQRIGEIHLKTKPVRRGA